MISFWRSQATSLISSAADFGVYGFLFYLLVVNYVVASAIGNISGAILSFYLGRNWSFKSQDGNVSTQAIKYGITSMASAGINSAGIYLLTENTILHPTYSKVIIALLVGITFNFFMFRYFVFKR
jgi:putative flippase GtrA